jgi:hypothetical protein
MGMVTDTVAILTGCGHVRNQRTARQGIRALRNLMVTNGRYMAYHLHKQKHYVFVVQQRCVAYLCRETISVALWGSNAEAFDAETCIDRGRQEAIVLLLCGLTCRLFNGKNFPPFPLGDPGLSLLLLT